MHMNNSSLTGIGGVSSSDLYIHLQTAVYPERNGNASSSWLTWIHHRMPQKWGLIGPLCGMIDRKVNNLTFLDLDSCSNVFFFSFSFYASVSDRLLSHLLLFLFLNLPNPTLPTLSSHFLYIISSLSIFLSISIYIPYCLAKDTPFSTNASWTQFVRFSVSYLNWRWC